MGRIIRGNLVDRELEWYSDFIKEILSYLEENKIEDIRFCADDVFNDYALIEYTKEFKGIARSFISIQEKKDDDGNFSFYKMSLHIETEISDYEYVKECKVETVPYLIEECDHFIHLMKIQTKEISEYIEPIMFQIEKIIEKFGLVNDYDE